MTAGEIVAIIAAVGGLAGALVTSVISARKSELDTLRSLIETIQHENERLRERVGELETENKALRGEVDALRCELDKERTQPRRKT